MVSVTPSYISHMSSFHTAHFCTVHLQVILTIVPLCSCFLFSLFSHMFMYIFASYHEYWSRGFLHFNAFTGFSTATNHHLGRFKNYREISPLSGNKNEKHRMDTAVNKLIDK